MSVHLSCRPRSTHMECLHLIQRPRCYVFVDLIKQLPWVIHMNSKLPVFIYPTLPFSCFFSITTSDMFRTHTHTSSVNTLTTNYSFRKLSRLHRTWTHTHPVWTLWQQITVSGSYHDYTEHGHTHIQCEHFDNKLQFQEVITTTQNMDTHTSSVNTLTTNYSFRKLSRLHRTWTHTHPVWTLWQQITVSGSYHDYTEHGHTHIQCEHFDNKLQFQEVITTTQNMDTHTSSVNTLTTNYSFRKLSRLHRTWTHTHPVWTLWQQITVSGSYHDYTEHGHTHIQCEHFDNKLQFQEVITTTQNMDTHTSSVNTLTTNYSFRKLSRLHRTWTHTHPVWTLWQQITVSGSYHDYTEHGHTHIQCEHFDNKLQFQEVITTTQNMDTHTSSVNTLTTNYSFRKLSRLHRTWTHTHPVWTLWQQITVSGSYHDYTEHGHTHIQCEHFDNKLQFQEVITTTQNMDTHTSSVNTLTTNYSFRKLSLHRTWTHTHPVWTLWQQITVSGSYHDYTEHGHTHIQCEHFDNKLQFQEVIITQNISSKTITRGVWHCPQSFT